MRTEDHPLKWPKRGGHMSIQEYTKSIQEYIDSYLLSPLLIIWRLQEIEESILTPSIPVDNAAVEN